MPPDAAAENLSKFRIGQASKCLQSARRALDADDFMDAANRSYYCVFHAMRAVHALDRFDSKKHSGVIDNFIKNYIRTKIFPVEFSDVVKYAFEVRLESDYADFYVVSKSDVTAQVENAERFLAAVEKHIDERIAQA
ncbi:hypothetical protein R80B4_03082 [Fibrobacteres bacterium R8-0-B4]